MISLEKNNYDDFFRIGWSTKQIISQFNKKTNLSFGGFYDDLLVSFILGDLFNIENISEYEILLIYVCKSFRKKCLGTRLIKKIEENNSTLKKIYLEVAENNLEAISFYKKMSFKKINTRKNYFFLKHKKVDALIMSKKY